MKFGGNNEMTHFIILIKDLFYPMEKTIFAKISDHEIPAHIVYEDEGFMAFLDVLPMALGHVIVIPRKTYSSLESMTTEVANNFFAIVKKIGAAMLDGLGVVGYSLMLDNTDSKSSESSHIQHVHFHVIPRHATDPLENRPQGSYDDGQAEDYVEKIKQAMEQL
jgi:histidine triad (HIT) family protein